MKQKVLRSLLFGLVLAVWGAVVYRASKRPVPPEMALLQTPPSPVRNGAAPIKVVPRYSLSRDPFLDGSAPSRTKLEYEATRASSTGTVPPKDRKPVEEVSWPSVSINGILRATDGVHYAATASINGQGHVLRPGVRSGPFMVRSITRETVVLELDGIQKEYRATAPL